MKTYYVTCDNCGKQQRSDSKKVKWDDELLEWSCVECKIVTACFTRSELQRMIDAMDKNNKTAVICSGHVALGQWHKARKIRS